MTAIEEALKIARDLQDREIVIISDSQYAIDVCDKFRELTPLVDGETMMDQ